MAYGKLRDMVELATELQASSIGLTIEEIMVKTERSRKTVERMLNALYEIGLEVKISQLDQDHHLVKRYRIEQGLPRELLILKSEERTALERHLQALSNNFESKALKKLLATQQPLGKALAINTAELVDKTTHINQIGPRLKVHEAHMVIIENAILGFQKLKIKYRAKGNRRASFRIIEPLGLLFGRFGYLVANNTKTDMKPLTYRLDLIEEIMTSKELGMFKKPEKWDFKLWAKESFGVFHGDAQLNIRLRFTGEAAKRAKKIQFHPSQKTTRGSHNSTIIHLKCRGHWELIHELLHPYWLGQVSIEEPYSLKEEFANYISQATKAVS